MTHYSDETIQELFKTEPLKMAILQEIINYLFESQSDENFQVKLHSGYVESYLELAETIDGLVAAERDALKAANAELVEKLLEFNRANNGLRAELERQIAWVKHIEPQANKLSQSVLWGFEQAIKNMSIALKQHEAQHGQ